MKTICETLFGKTYKELNEGEKTEYHSIMGKASYRRKKMQKKPYEHCKTYQMFGCKRTEMTLEQQKAYNTRRCVEYQRRMRWEKKNEQNN